MTRFPRSRHSWTSLRMSLRTTPPRFDLWRNSMRCTRETGRPNACSPWKRRSILKGFRYFRQLIREGISDGSLRADLNPNLTLQAVLNAVIGAQRRLASLGNKVELEFGQPIDRLFRETIRIVVLGLRATPSQAAKKTSEQLKAVKNNARKRSS